MPYIKTIPPVEATGKLKENYQSGAGPSAARGKVSMIRQVQASIPKCLTASLDALRPRRQGVGSEEFFEQLDDFIIARQIPDELGQRFRHQRRRVVADFFVLFEKLGIIERAAHGLLKNRHLIIRRAWRQHERSPG